jgi:hypothetical protein
MATWITRLGITRLSLMNAARTAIATVASLLLAKLLKLNEFYWAPISTIVILLSTINPLAGSCQLRGNRRRSCIRCTDRDIVSHQLGSLLCRNFYLRNPLRSAANQRVLPHRRPHPEHRPANHPRQRAVDDSPAPLHRSVGRNRCSAADYNRLESPAGRLDEN